MEPNPNILHTNEKTNNNNNTNETYYSIDSLPLTIRFSASIPDLLLDITTPTTTAAGLKQQIRSRLPDDLSKRRLRLIYAGRGLGDTDTLTGSLKLQHRFWGSGRNVKGYGDADIITNKDEDVDNDKGKGKGKEVVRDNRQRVYVHCSIGDIVLSDDELRSEAGVISTVLIQQKRRQDAMRKGIGVGIGIGGGGGGRRFRASSSSEYDLESGGQTVHEGNEEEEKEVQQQQQHQQHQSTTTPAPRGFARLLSTGFTPAEVSALRSQFLAIQSVSRTPDTMPTGSELREMEDRWLDEGTSAASAGLGVGGGGGAADGPTLGGDDDGGFGTGSRGAIEDMLWGAVMGFFWPVGCIMWLRREEGVWSWRKGLAVFIGVVVNAALGLMQSSG